MLRELQEALNRVTGVALFCRWASRRGAELVRDQMLGTPTNPDPRIFFNPVENPASPAVINPAIWRRSELLERSARGGMVDVTLGWQWVAFVYTEWEHHYRQELARAHGCKREEVLAPLLGDLWHLRHDILHARGVATRYNAGRCKVLKHWFAPGEPIHLTPDHYAEFMHLFPWDHLRAKPAAAG